MRTMYATKLMAYMLVFWAVLGLVRLLTGILLIFRFASIAAALRRRGQRARVLYLAAFFPGNAGYEQRVHSWAKILRESGFGVEIRWCLDHGRFEDFVRPAQIVRFHLAFLVKRAWHCLKAPVFDAVIVRRELLLYNDYGGLFMERFLLALNSNVALDFDDDIAAAKREPRPISTFGKLMVESSSKFGDSLRLYRRFIVGSSYLQSTVRASNVVAGPEDVVVIPTCVDVADYPLKRYGTPQGDDGPIVFGWIGSIGNLTRLDLILPALEIISREHPIKMIVISGRAFTRNTSFEIVSLPWSCETQGDSLRLIDIGLMPLFDRPEERGKCGFKLIQYMACGMVSVASAVTTNVEIVEDGVNGFLVRREGDWEGVLREVLRQKDRFEEIGREARKTVVSGYSFDAYRVRYGEFVARLGGRDKDFVGRVRDMNGDPTECQAGVAARRH